MSKHTLTPDDFLNNDQRSQLMKTCKVHADADLLNGRITWPVRWMLVDLALFSGLRVAEIAALKIKDLTLKGEDKHIIVRKGKGDKKRTVYIDESLAEHLRGFLSYKDKTLDQSIAPDKPLFKGRNGHNPPITLMKSFKRAIEAAGLPEHFSIHNARHTYATFLLKDTGSLRYVAQQLGHTNLNMTKKYAKILPEENGKMANKIKRPELQ